MREAEGRRTFTGTGVGRGVVAGPVLRMPEPLAEPSADPFDGDVAQEQARAARALIDTRAELEARARRAGGHAQDVLEAQAVMADDPALAEDVAARIAAGRTAERAVFEALATVQQVLFNLGEPMAARATDVGDVSQRIIVRLLGRPVPGPPDSDEPFVLVAADLAPADAALLDLDLVLALVTSGGSATSHTAILAREQSLIAVVGVAGAEQFEDGEIVLVDAGAGVVTGSPTTREVRSARSTAAARVRVSPRSPGELADGTPVPLLANLGSVGAAVGALALGAEGVGLFRTELLFLDRSEAPGVAEQAQRYGELLAAFPGRRVVVRVFDAGADKPLAFLGPDSVEPNPALGVRGLRALRAREEVLRDQLTALALAQDATDAELWVMAPMVADLPEAAAFVTLAKRLGLRTVGVMVEVPSSALLAAQILGVADFVSIGTNDLTQYTLAADRLLAPLGSYQDPWHPAVLRLIKLVGDAGLASGRSIGVCGEAAADPLLAVVLVGLGATSLSVAPAALGDVRTELRRYTLEAARAMAMDALSAASPAEARAAALA
ncbi:phosphoenolpyruvate--protein phosphotransferase [Plantibacter sp. VKM Ac-2880]|uniref:phosphoenolpyruvate--protein phosphotransferase n=1 Tax=Plantibacter sp. VKM Ac-2880 TaxID=2783827 RepID=UPI00188ED019|nr:phosphoenolpyruvate--protein phosphotransferase [Plantibacter sp. VKM Ac-2880]MBF4569898.1 phosphoenolpyruvate--protein phosphotransferase [Plantibacter sp. VKM Ac-2880]